jgi:hypothetical protein
MSHSDYHSGAIIADRPKKAIAGLVLNFNTILNTQKYQNPSK